MPPCFLRWNVCRVGRPLLLLLLMLLFLLLLLSLLPEFPFLQGSCGGDIRRGNGGGVTELGRQRGP